MKKFAFTLAEVLITLGIIGIVAALTIPILAANTNGAQYRNKFKKALSTLNQAVRLNVSKYDYDFSNTDYFHHGNCNIYNLNQEEVMSVCDILNSNLSGHTFLSLTPSYTNGNKNADYFIEKPKDSNAYFNRLLWPDDFMDYPQVQLSDGTLVMFYDINTDDNNNNICTKGRRDEIIAHSYNECTGFIDVNGLKGPNKEVECSTGEISYDLKEPCTVKGRDVTDIYPFFFYDSTIEPLTNAADYVLKSAK